MTSLTDDVIREELNVYGAPATDLLCDAIRAYIPLLLHWNRKISLTTVTNPLEILRFHFGESMFAASLLLSRNGRLADVGSGAGFPGIPLKLVVPGLKLVLIESNAKKVAFLAEVVRDLSLEGVEICRVRFEDFVSGGPKFDFITARALGMHQEFVKWARRAINDGGSLILWLGESDASKISRINSWHWQTPLSIPGSHSRAILVGSVA